MNSFYLGIIIGLAVVIVGLGAWIGTIEYRHAKAIGHYKAALQDAQVSEAGWKQSSANYKAIAELVRMKQKELETRNTNLDRIITSKDCEILNLKEVGDEARDTLTLMSTRVAELVADLETERDRLSRAGAILAGKA